VNSVRSARLTGPRQVEIGQRQLPRVKRLQVQVEILENGLCGSDGRLWIGDEPSRFPDWLGHEAAGIVAEIGEDVETLDRGDLVALWLPASGGGLGEAVVAEECHCVRVKPDAQFVAAGEPLGCCVQAVEMAAPGLGATVAVIGGGWMAMVIAQLSLLRGASSVLVAARRDYALAQARAFGVTDVVNVQRDSLRDAAWDLTHGAGFDVAYEVTGSQEGLDLIGEVTRPGGAAVEVGYHQSGAGVRTRDEELWNRKALRMVNAHFGGDVMAGIRAGMRLVEAGRIDVASLVTHTFPLREVAEALETVVARPDGYFKAVVRI
jgi:threonine dehydrogenase-like Zn-dependent dehydrogenase